MRSDSVFSPISALQFAVVQHFNTAKVKPVHALIDCRGEREGGGRGGEGGGGRGHKLRSLPRPPPQPEVFANRWISISMKIVHRRSARSLARAIFDRGPDVFPSTRIRRNRFLTNHEHRNSSKLILSLRDVINVILHVCEISMALRRSLMDFS